MWKGRLLSMVGRICLIKSVLNSFFSFPSLKLLNRCVMPSGQSILGSYGVGILKGEKSHGLPLPIELGGLGVRDIQVFNSALVAKWK